MESVIVDSALKGRARGRIRSDSCSVSNGVSHAFVLLMLMFSAVTVALISCVLFGFESAGAASWAVIASFVLNGILSCCALVKDAAARSFSLVQIHWLFFLTFFVVAPLSQYAVGYFCWGYLISDPSYLRANFLLFIWAVLFFAFSTVRAKRPKVDSRGADKFFEGLPQVSRDSVAILVLLSAAATAGIVVLAGFENLFSRSTFSLGLDQTLTLLLEKVLRCTPLFAFAFTFVRFKQRRDCLGSLALCTVLLFLADFPFGMERYNAAAMYGGLMLLCVPVFRKCKGAFPVFFLLLFLVVFPASNVFRYNEFDLSLLSSAVADAFFSFGKGFSTEDYDAYSMLVRSVDYIEAYGATNGVQLLGVLLFFVPRSIWPEKPVGSGVTIATDQGQAFTNVSCPLPAEGIMNFGFVGLVLFAAIFGMLCRRIDAKGNVGGWAVFYPSLCFLFFFVLRGDLLSSFAYLVGFAAVYLIALFVVLSSPRPLDSFDGQRDLKKVRSAHERTAVVHQAISKLDVLPEHEK